MREGDMGEMNLVVSDIPVYRGAVQDQRRRRQQGDLTAVYAFWMAELEAMKRAQQTHAQSMMMLVHELRSPAAASKSMVATFRHLHPQDTQVDSFLATIEDRMDQLLGLVDDILELSEAKAGQGLGPSAVLDLAAETTTACEPYLEEAAVKGLSMSLVLRKSAVLVRMAERAYQLIVSNLVSNAVKYTAAGSVRVTLHQEGDWAVLTVQDTGIGIPPDEIQHVCTEFYRASNARTGHTPGTGLGLAAVRTLVEGCGGELELQSEEGQGSRFTVRLPLCPLEAAQEAESCPAAERRGR